jgi:O-succinylbenzoic acid--CoA ligase
MSAFAGLTLSGKYFSSEWILKHFDDLEPSAFTKQELRSLTFCGQWLSGGTEFAIKTSGSTGTPKPISIHRSRIEKSVRMTADALKLKAGDHAFVCLSTEYIGGLMMLARGLVLNLKLHVVEPQRDPFQSIALNATAQFDFFSFVPLQLQTLFSANLDYIPLVNKARAILVGGAPISHPLITQTHKISAPVYHTFGMTETVSHIALRRLNGPAASEAFTALNGVHLGQDQRGCLTIKSDVAARDEITTNDLVELKSEREFIWLGRNDNVINTGGVKVQAEVVERGISKALQALFGLTHPYENFFVGPIPDAIYGERIAAIFERVHLSAGEQTRLKAALSKTVQKHEVPRQILSVPNFERARNGKINRKATLKKATQIGLGDHTNQS